MSNATTPAGSSAARAHGVTAHDVPSPQDTVARHGAGTADHQALVDKGAALGLRTLSLSIHDDPAHPLSAAVTIKHAPNHAESQVFPRTLAQVQAGVQSNAAIGRGLYLVGATGGEGKATQALASVRESMALGRRRCRAEARRPWRAARAGHDLCISDTKLIHKASRITS
jgi:hypothetical protein